MSELTTMLEQQEFYDEVVANLRVGVHWSTETEIRRKSSSSHTPPHRVCQVFSSATPVSYGKLCRPSEWQAFATTILEGTFEATLAVAAVIAAQERRRVQVFLTSVGAGAFGNSTIWLERALRRALVMFASHPLDVKLVHYGTAPANKRNKFRVLEKSWRLRRRLAKASNSTIEGTSSEVMSECNEINGLDSSNSTTEGPCSEVKSESNESNGLDSRGEEKKAGERQGEENEIGQRERYIIHSFT
jgi:hypothetical protein